MVNYEYRFIRVGWSDLTFIKFIHKKVMVEIYTNKKRWNLAETKQNLKHKKKTKKKKKLKL